MLCLWPFPHGHKMTAAAPGITHLSSKAGDREGATEICPFVRQTNAFLGVNMTDFTIFFTGKTSSYAYLKKQWRVGSKIYDCHN